MTDLLLPAENMVLTVARAQVERGATPTLSISAVLVMALDRLIDEIPDGDLYAPVDCHIHEVGDNIYCVDGDMRKVERITP
ncbi:hypothetical protein LCGC14_2422890 [marine sediment metagenome]|uniref:Uncharacterized protein n=1 Tax=marine sediment metagenome TaxID=412755 RepID=A0A0F9EID9_9ZZZZ